MILRAATPADVEAMAAVINAAYLVEEFFIEGPRTNAKELAGLMSEPDVTFLVIDHPERTGLAGAVCARVDGRRGHLSLLAVNPQLQGRGLGRLLVDGVAEHCRHAGCDRVELEVFDARVELPAVYAALGFTTVGPVPYAHPEQLRRPSELIRMTRPLTRSPRP